MTHPSLTVKCVNCGMPLAEGPLLTSSAGLVCEECFERLPEQMVCDFCGEREPQWFYESDPIGFVAAAEEDIVITDMGEGWAACDSCSIIILNDDATAMCDRILALREMPEIIKRNEEAKRDFKEVMLTYFIVVLGVLKRPPTKKE